MTKIGGPDDPQDPYLERIARECMACKAEVEGKISSAIRNPALAEDLTAQAIKQVIEYAGQHRADEEKIENVKSFLITTVKHLLSDALTRKRKADKLETVSWDGAADGGILNLPDESPTNAIERRLEAAEIKGLMLGELKPAQRELFDMWIERGMTPAEISAHLHITPAAVRLRIHTLVARMREAVTKLGLS